MPESAQPLSNFSFLQKKHPELARLGMLSERYFPDDPNTSLLKARQFSEALAQSTAARINLYSSSEEPQSVLLRRLDGSGVVPCEIIDLFHSVRKTGNAANHALSGDHSQALAILKGIWQLGLWFQRTFHQQDLKSGPFLPPRPPIDPTQDLREELDRLRRTLEEQQVQAHVMHTLADEKAFWEQMAQEAERDRVMIAHQLATLQAEIAAKPQRTLTEWTQVAQKAAQRIELDELSTRQLIDQQLVEAGWEADTVQLRYNKGTRPERGRNRAIAEWPTPTGPADYVLFVGMDPVAIIEAKRKNIDVSSALSQAERYNLDLKAPFVFSANGRPFVPQLRTKSGIWFRDIRHRYNLSRPLEGWYSPEGLRELLQNDPHQAHKALDQEPFQYGFELRPYQIEGIRAVEKAIEDQQREILLAMATGTGKTKTCIALIYRLLKTKRFRRILFLVDRSALGAQAADAFKETRMEGLTAFADTFGIKELADTVPDKATKVHIATIQGMVKRVILSDEAPPVDQYDAIVVDECHRGYLLDRELSDTEVTFRDFDDYVSKYRRVLEYFDAIKIGLTATPALHTTQIFHQPVFTYSYREAVIDGFLVDYEPPYQIRTQLSEGGIHWEVGETVQVYLPQTQTIDLIEAPDVIHLEVDSFNRRVITESFNRVVCQYLAQELDPASPRKTLVFCASDEHADMVVTLLKKAFEKQYGSVENDAVVKITGTVDKPLEAIRRYKNEKLPNIAVTVDLLTTGIDVPEICNLVFLRRVNSRILFEQMLGRATRLCSFGGDPKETFRVFDAVQIFDDLKGLTEMLPVVVDPKVPFSQLETELASLSDDDSISLVRDQFVAKLQAKKRHLSEEALDKFEVKAGVSVDEFLTTFKTMQLDQVSAWFAQHPSLGEILDRTGGGIPTYRYISGHEDHLVRIERGYGESKKPEDYLEAFAQYVQSHQNELPALVTLMTRPRDLTRADLKSLIVELDRQGFSETNLDSAWKQLSNQDMAARIVGHLRRAALGSPLVPYEERVDLALAKLLAQRTWTTPQKDWLRKISAQTKANLWVDRAFFDDSSLLFKQESGGFERLDKRLFEGKLTTILDDFHEALWSDHG